MSEDQILTPEQRVAATSRFDYVKYDDAAAAQQATAKILVQQLEKFITSFGLCRPSQLAIDKLEECYMWVGKLIRDQQIMRQMEPPQLQEGRTDS